MDKLYSEVCDELEEAIRRFANNELEYEDLLIVGEKEKLFHNEGSGKNELDWEKEIKNLKIEISGSLLKMYKNTIEISQGYIDELKDKIKDENFIEVEEEKIKANSFILGRNKMPEEGAESSQWYLPPYPDESMVTNLKEDE